MKKHPIVLVIWTDAESVDAWTHSNDLDHTITPIESVGWLIADTAESVTLALNHDTKNGNYSCIMKIPKGMVNSRKTLRK